ncbi:MAG: NADH-quinone oxidoreductase subunit B [Planctomycetota bacterium]|jgi:NADH-quinone oxidoreductase subunit B
MGLEALLPQNVLTTQLKKLVNWGRKNSLWPMPFGTACCAIEMMAALASRYDMSRFGSEVIRFSPRQSDLMIVSGRIALKMMPVLFRVWQQMPEPKWCIAMGACASCGGVFDNYAMIQGVDRFLPVDVYIPGCPPRPEGLIDALMMIQKKIDKEDLRSHAGTRKVK